MSQPLLNVPPWSVRLHHVTPLLSLHKLADAAVIGTESIAQLLHKMCTIRGVVTAVSQVDIRQRYRIYQCLNGKHRISVDMASASLLTK